MSDLSGDRTRDLSGGPSGDLSGADEAEWAITVYVPVRAGRDAAHAIFEAVADAAHDAQPADRDWDVLTVGVGPIVPLAGPVHPAPGVEGCAAADQTDPTGTSHPEPEPSVGEDPAGTAHPRVERELICTCSFYPGPDHECPHHGECGYHGHPPDAGDGSCHCGLMGPR